MQYSSQACLKNHLDYLNLLRALHAMFIAGVFKKSFRLSQLLRAFHATFITGVFKKSFRLSSFLECK